MLMKMIQPTEMPAPSGHYSPAVIHNGTIYISGQLPLGPDGKLNSPEIRLQAHLCLMNIKMILNACGTDMNSLLKVTIFVSDINDWPMVNEVYARVLGTHRPARIVVPVKSLNYGCAIEIDAIAALNNHDENKQ
jgi:reactive intermediate/imine deaminase